MAERQSPGEGEGKAGAPSAKKTVARKTAGGRVLAGRRKYVVNDEQLDEPGVVWFVPVEAMKTKPVRLRSIKHVVASTRKAIDDEEQAREAHQTKLNHLSFIRKELGQPGEHLRRAKAALGVKDE